MLAPRRAAGQSAQPSAAAARADAAHDRHRRVASPARLAVATSSATPKPTHWPRRSHAARCCCSPTRSTASSSRRTCARRCACCAPPATAPFMPHRRGRPLCCGRTWLAAGMVDKAREEARRTMGRLGGDLPVIGLEPSCLFTLRDEFRSLLPGAEADALARRAMLLVGVPGKRKARSGAAAAARDRACARPLPPEIVRRVSRGAGRVAAHARTER